jgi:hypothetical protein
MLSRAQKCLVLVVLVLLTSSCTKLPQWSKAGQGNLAIETLPTMGSIPLKWGNLVTVTSSPDVGFTFQLWFQDEQGNLRMVLCDIRTNSLVDVVRFIPRK